MIAAGTILNFVYNHAASRHCLNKFSRCSRLAVYFNIFILPFFGPVFFGLVYQVFKQWQEKIVSGIHE